GPFPDRWRNGRQSRRLCACDLSLRRQRPRRRRRRARQLERGAGRGIRDDLLAAGRRGPLAEEGLRSLADAAEPGFALIDEQIERWREVAPADPGQQAV